MAHTVKIVYRYDHVPANKILSAVKDFEDALFKLDADIVCKSFEIACDEEY